MSHDVGIGEIVRNEYHDIVCLLGRESESAGKSGEHDKLHSQSICMTYAVISCRHRDGLSVLGGEISSGTVDCLVRDCLGLEVGVCNGIQRRVSFRRVSVRVR